MNSELEILKKIWNHKGKSSPRLISHRTGLGIDYTRYILNSLFKKGQINLISGKRDWYQITSLGKKELKMIGIINPKASRKVDKVEKVIYYLPKKLKAKAFKSNFQETKIRKPKVSKTKEIKLDLGKTIEKVVSFFRGI